MIVFTAMLFDQDIGYYCILSRDIIGDVGYHCIYTMYCHDIIGDLSVSQYIVGVCSRSGLHRESLQHEH